MRTRRSLILLFLLSLLISAPVLLSSCRHEPPTTPNGNGNGDDHDDDDDDHDDD